MADPFSIVSGSLNITDICVRVVKYLKDVHKAAATIEKDITALLHEVDALGAVAKSIQQTFQAELSPPLQVEAREKFSNTAGLWEHVGGGIRDCQDVIGKIEKLVIEIYGKKGPAVVNSRDGFAKSHRKKAREGELSQCRIQLNTYQSVLQILMTTINLYVLNDHTSLCR